MDRRRIERPEAGDSAYAAAELLIDHHRSLLRFRRTLRALSLTDDAVRAARTKSCLAQIEKMTMVSKTFRSLPTTGHAASLFMIERLADACAEGEFRDLGYSQSQERVALACLIAEKLGLCEAE